MLSLSLGLIGWCKCSKRCSWRQVLVTKSTQSGLSDAPDSQLVRTFLLQVVKSRIYLVVWQIWFHGRTVPKYCRRIHHWNATTHCYRQMTSWFRLGSEEKREQHATCLTSSFDSSQLTIFWTRLIAAMAGVWDPTNSAILDHWCDSHTWPPAVV